MWFPALAAIPAIVSAASTAGAAIAGTGTFLGLSASTLGAIGTAASLVGTGVGAIGQIQQSKAEAAINDQNAKLAQQRQLDAQRRGSQEEGELRTRYQKFIGTQRAAMGGSGVVVDEGSGGDVLADTAELGERDAQRVRMNAAKEAWGYGAEASIYKSQAAQARASGPLKAGTTLLGGTMDILRKPPWWDIWRQQNSNSILD